MRLLINGDSKSVWEFPQPRLSLRGMVEEPHLLSPLKRLGQQGHLDPILKFQQETKGPYGH